MSKPVTMLTDISAAPTIREELTTTINGSCQYVGGVRCRGVTPATLW